MKAAVQLTRSNICPRCKSGFIVFNGSVDGEASCLNCGHHLESNITSEDQDLFTIQRRLNGLPPETVVAEDLAHAIRARHQVNKAGLDL